MLEIYLYWFFSLKGTVSLEKTLVFLDWGRVDYFEAA